MRTRSGGEQKKTRTLSVALEQQWLPKDESKGRSVHWTRQCSTHLRGLYFELKLRFSILRCSTAVAPES
jgi:hypothetical protein